MNQREVAKAMGISRTWLQVLEHRGLVKIALACGGIVPELPRWQRRYQAETREADDREQRRLAQRRRRAAAKAGSGEGGNVICVTLPIRLLSEANQRGHWSKGAKRAKEQRTATLWAVLSRIVPTSGGGWATMPDWRLTGEQGLAVTLVRIAPRNLDTDNLARAFKAIRDGVADALGVNDNDPRIEWRYEQRKSDGHRTPSVPPYAIEIRIDLRT